MTYEKRLVEMVLFSLERDITIVFLYNGNKRFSFSVKEVCVLRSNKGKNPLKVTSAQFCKEVVRPPSLVFPKRVGTIVCHK